MASLTFRSISRGSRTSRRAASSFTRPHVRRESRSLRNNVDIVIRDNRIEQVVDHRADLPTGRVIDAAPTW
jgi:hypothetical protein